MVDEQESKKIKTEAEEISRELCAVFKDHLENTVKTEDKLQEIVYDIALKTLVCKANRDNPVYPEKKEMMERTLYISKMQAKQLLNREIQKVERIIPKQLLETNGSLKINVELSD